MSATKQTTLTIDFKKLKQNFEFLKSKLQPNTKVLAVVKAFAYGSDAEEVAKELQELNVDYFAVAYTNEGVALRKAGIHKPILVLHPQPINFKEIIDNCLEPSLYSFRVLNDFVKVAERLNQKNYPVHIKFNTGLNRLGFIAKDVKAITQKTNQASPIKVTSIFSHLAASEDSKELEFTKKQINQFKEIRQNFNQLSNHKPFAHLCNTSGILNYPKAHLDMVRTGIGLYGFGNDAKFNKELQPIASLTSVISQIHTLQVGDSLGYNRAYIANKITKTATIPIGHADGIGRQYGNGLGSIIINNQKAAIIGNVCMDMIMVDITHINCNEGDEVVIYNGIFTASEFSKSVTSISYEIITATSQRIKRVFYR
ncbi:alanine racemase [Pseudofulvibacter geojedonensis]|uniref:Alanine racemase n=1 Tax=Pseudofulvibacter geojedonensis TaxID=1123758 RepID=A0ABW3I086_9FLAO